MTIEESRANIGADIAAEMKRQGIGKDKLAQISNVSKFIIYKILRGQNYEITSLIRITSALRLTIKIMSHEQDN